MTQALIATLLFFIAGSTWPIRLGEDREFDEFVRKLFRIFGVIGLLGYVMVGSALLVMYIMDILK